MERPNGWSASRDHSPNPQIRIEGRNYPTKSVVFIWMTGSAPRGVIKPRSGDPSDLRWDSIRQDINDGEKQSKFRLEITAVDDGGGGPITKEAAPSEFLQATSGRDCSEFCVTVISR